MRNWLTAFRPASFRGVRFKVDGEGMSGQRRLSISPIAYAERSVIEDMGRDPMVWPLVAYVSGDAADGEARALTGALSMRGPGLLILPMHGSVRVRVQDFQRDRRKDAAGHIAFSITFIEEGLGGVPFAPLAGAGPVADLLAQGGGVIGSALGIAFAGLSASRQSPQNDELAASAVRAAAVAATTASGDVPAKLVTEAVTLLADIAPAGIDRPGDYGSALAGAWRMIALNSDPSELRGALGAELRAVPVSTAGIADHAIVCGALAVAVVRPDYRSRQDARAAREELGRVCAPTLAAIGPSLGDDAFAWLSSVTGEASEILSRTAASRAPLLRVETQLSLSAIAASYQLYGDANRAQEIVDRNRCGTAAFMPIAFEALAQ